MTKTSEPESPAASPAASPTFQSLGLNDALLRAIAEVGYEVPTSIQAATIPPLLAGRDLIGQAQTGTGKTAAFGLPLLQRVDPTVRDTQALVLTPTRELAIQVAEALHAYAKHLPGLGILPVYGGQPIDSQQRRLQRGVQVVVGTPGRLMDHARRGTLRFDRLRMVVLDEADEMLRMGFIEDVEWILSQAPPASAGRQTALFSATMPREIRRIAEQHLHEPAALEIAHKAMTLPAIEQRFLLAPYPQKLEALTRLLESEVTDAVLVFTRTKTAAAEVAEKLEARGYSVAAMHGDMTQPLRERVIERLRNGSVEIVVATDVAARGLDVDRISHVINFDIPNDVESYVHRIGRTGRAGRKGIAVLFVTPRERHMLREIERFTGRTIAPMAMPTQADVAARRKEEFKATLRETIAKEDLELYLGLVEELVEEGLDVAEIGAAAAFVARRDRPLTVSAPPPVRPLSAVEDRNGMVRLVFDAGRGSGVRPADLVGAIANEAGVPGREIGGIDIHDTVSIVEVRSRQAAQVMERLAGATLRGQVLTIRVADDTDPKRRTKPSARPTSKPGKPFPKSGKGGAGAGARSETGPKLPWSKRPK